MSSRIKPGDLVRYTYDDYYGEYSYRYGIVIKIIGSSVYAWWQQSKPKARDRYRSLPTSVLNDPRNHTWIYGENIRKLTKLGVDNWKTIIEGGK